MNLPISVKVESQRSRKQTLKIKKMRGSLTFSLVASRFEPVWKIVLVFSRSNKLVVRTTVVLQVSNLDINSLKSSHTQVVRHE